MTDLNVPGKWRPTPWLTNYTGSWLRDDAVTAVTVWALLIPQALAYSQLAGLPPVHGLYAALGALVLYGVWGTSRHLNLGPEATIATLVATILTPLAAGEPSQYLMLAAVLALLTGLILFVAGLLRLGVVTRLLSTPVLIGYITGSAIVIIIGQLDDLLGITVDVSQYHTKLGAVLRNLGETNGLDAAIGLATIAGLLIVRRIAPRVPSYLIAVILAIAGTATFGWDGSGASVVGEIEGGLPTPGFGGVAVSDVVGLLFPALAIALLIYVDSVATVKAVAEKKGYEVDPNREFLGLALANAGAGLLQGFPVNGSQSRSFAAADAGAKSQVSNWIVAGLVLVTLLFLTRPFELLPSATLAGIVVVVGIGLIDLSGFRRLWHIRRTDFVFAAITTVGVVTVGMLAGVLIAVILSLFDVTRRALTPHTAVLVREPGTDRFRDRDEVEDGRGVPGLLVYRFDAPLIFANVDVAIDEMKELLETTEPSVQAVLLSAEAVTDIDITAIDALDGFFDQLRESGIAVGIARLKGGVADQLGRAGVLADSGNLYLEVDDGVDAYLSGHFGPVTGESS